jgi:hypothetical protein
MESSGEGAVGLEDKTDQQTLLLFYVVLAIRLLVSCWLITAVELSHHEV